MPTEDEAGVFNPTHLHTFYLVAREGGFTAAARRLHLTQPAVSRHIQVLESALGSPLFSRRDRRIELSGAGRELFEYAEQMARLSREAARAMEEFRNLHRGEVLLAASTTPGNYVLPTAIAAFRRMHPQVAVALTVANSAEAVHRVEIGAVDLGVIGGPVDAANVVCEPYVADEIRLVAAAGHPLSQADATIQALASETLVAREVGSSTQSVVDAQVARWGLVFRERATFGGTEAIKRAVEGGLGVAYVSAVTATCEIQTGRLVPLAGPCTTIPRRFQTITRRGGRLSRAAQAFRECLRQTGATGVPGLETRAPR